MMKEEKKMLEQEKVVKVIPREDKDAVVVGKGYHFWLNDEDDIYDEKYGKQ